RRTDIADRLAGVIDALKHPEQSLVRLRSFYQPHQHTRHDTEHSFAADDSTAQIVTGHLLAAVGFAPQPDHFAFGQDHLEAEDVIGRDAVFERVRSAGV